MTPPVRWLTSGEQKVWRSFLAMRATIDDAIERDLQQLAGMPHAYYMILAMLSEAPHRRLQMSQLAEATHASQSRTSHAVSALMKKGWVERSSDEHDRRVVNALLTDTGLTVLREAAPAHVATVRRVLFDALTKAEVRELARIADSVVDRDDAVGTRSES